MNKMTEWFPKNIKPVRVGVYQVDWYVPGNYEHKWFAYWGGKRWGFMMLTPEQAEHHYNANKGMRHHSMMWRGFTEERKASS